MKTDTITLYHNPRCSKSRAALELLRGRGIEPRIVEYLKTPPDAAELAAIVKRLDMQPERLLRKGEAVYQSEYGGRPLDAAACIAAMARHPILIERPIAVRGERAVLGRPPENVLALLD